MDCKQTITSTYQKHYPKLPECKYAFKRAEKVKQPDEALITGLFKENLVVNGIQKKSKVWPQTAVSVEEYKDFLKRLQCCKKELFKLYFREPDVDTSIIEGMLQDLEKTTYQCVYSPNEFVPRTEARRLAKAPYDNPNNTYHRTTYRTYYNRLMHLTRYKDVLLEQLSDDGQKLKNELRNIYHTGTTTYHVDLCVPAIETAKHYQLHDQPIDQYTLRRV